MGNNIRLSFVEEMILNPEYEGYIGGRIEVQHIDDIWPRTEIRWFTKDIEGFLKFRDTWDMKYVDKMTFETIRRIVEEEYCE